MAQATSWALRFQRGGIITQYHRLPRPITQSITPKIPFLGGMLVLGFGVLGKSICLSLIMPTMHLGAGNDVLSLQDFDRKLTFDADIPAGSGLYRRNAEGRHR